MKLLFLALALVLIFRESLRAVTLSQNINIYRKGPGMVSFLAIQQELVDAVHNPEKNLNIDHGIDIIKRNPGYDLYVFPELSATGYSRETFRNLDTLAEPPDSSSASFKRFSEVAREMNAHIIFSLPTYFHETGSNTKQYHISAFVVSPQGNLDAVYHKGYLFKMEQRYFKGGWEEDDENPITVIKINGVKLGLAICYDMRYPELWREMSMKHGVVGYIHMLCIEKDFSFNSWRTIATARSIENQAYVLSLNRAGSSYGGSMFIQPGTPGVPGYEATPVYCTLNNDEGIIGSVMSQEKIDKTRKEARILKDGESLFFKFKTLK